MLRLILGVCGTGKTQTIYTALRERSAKGQKSLLLVPEQFTSSAEAMVYKALGDAQSAFVTVTSFTGYAERILKQCGGVAVQTLSDAGRVVYVRRALDALSQELCRYQKQRRSFAFCTMCADMIRELKTAGVDGAALEGIAANGEDAEKLRELALIYRAYDALLENSVMDTADRACAAAEKLEQAFLADTAVFIDDFDGFTAPEYKMLEKLLLAESCTVALCADGLADQDGGLGLFSAVKQTAARLRALAARAGVDVALPQLLQTDYRHAASPGLAAVAELLAFAQSESANTEHVFITPARGIYPACKAVAARIAALAQSGVGYGEIAIICRSLDGYAPALKYELSLFNVPYFLDEAGTMDHSAPAAFLRAALCLAVRGLGTEPILRLLKTGVCGFVEESLAALENYAYTWAPGAKEWREPFCKNPAGFGEITKENEALLALAEALRSECVPHIEAFIQSTKNANATTISRALYALMQAFHAPENTLQAAARLRSEGAAGAADTLCATWDGVMGLLSEIEGLLQGCDVSAAEYDELFLLLLRACEVGRVPETQDSVIITTADRMRLDAPSVCFVLGVEEGQFPKPVGYSGLLTHVDREAIAASGATLPGSFEYRSLLEQMFFYRAFTAASKQLYVSYVPAAFGGAAMSAPLQQIYAALQCPQDVLSTQQLAATPKAALDLLGARYGENSAQTAALSEALWREGSEKPSLAAMQRMAQQAQFAIEANGLVREVLGDKLRLSPTKIEQYYTCGFAYFLQYVLGVRARKKAELSPLESGSLVHYILENALRESGEAFTALSARDIEALAARIADEYVAANMPEGAARFTYLITRIKRSAARLLLYVQDEQRQSSFHPVAFEQVIGNGGIEPLVLQTATGETVRVVGKIDRVDVMRREGKAYVRVIDYKTGEKAFSLDEVYNGLNTQMLFYLFTLCQSGAAGYENAVPAGVLYLAGDPSPKTLDARKDSSGPVFKLDGLVLDDPAVVAGMDKGGSGLFVPFTFKNDGTPKATKKLASLEKLGQIATHVEGLAVEMAARLYGGDIAARPLVTKARRPCDVCDYRPVCRHEDGVNEGCLLENTFA